MAQGLINDSTLDGIADAIRAKNGESTTYLPSQMRSAILRIPTGGGTTCVYGAYVVGSTDYDDDWLSYYDGGDPLVPTDEALYVIMGGSREGEVFHWNGDSYDSLPIGSDADPLMDGTASAGTSDRLAREDHVHPTDTTRASTATATPSTSGEGGTNGLMSASDKEKLNGIATGATANVPSTSAPIMDGTASAGSSDAYARGDHVHPTDTSRMAASLKGAANGVAELDANGHVPSAQLPSYVDDVLEYASLSSFPVTGETGKIYVALDTDLTYRWGGSSYVEISASLALGETDSTAYRGDRGKVAYDHATAKGSAFASGLYKVTTNSEGHVTNATAVQKSDITGLGIPAQDTTYSDATTSSSGLMSSTDKTKLDGIESGANNYELPTMSASTKGGAKLGHGLAIEDGALGIGVVTDPTDAGPISRLTAKGWAEQSGTPTPSDPKEIRVARGRNLLNLTRQVDGVNVSTGNNTMDNVTVENQVLSFTANTTNPYFGSAVTAGTAYASSQGALIPVEPNTAYYLSWTNLTFNQIFISEFGSDKVSLGHTSTSVPKAITTDANTRYVVVRIGIMSATVDNAYSTAVQLELGSTATPYVPYGHVGIDASLPWSLYKNDYYYSTTTDGTEAAYASMVIRRCPATEGVYMFRVTGKSTLSGNTSTRANAFDRNGKWLGALGNAGVSANMSATFTVLAPLGTAEIRASANKNTDFELIHSIPVPLPSRGWVAALPDGTADTLTLDGAGGYVWTLNVAEVVLDGSSDEAWLALTNTGGCPQLASDVVDSLIDVSSRVNAYVSHFIIAASIWGGSEGLFNIVDANRHLRFNYDGTASDFATWLASNPVTVLYPLATPTTEQGYVEDWDNAIPAHAAISCPELRDLAVRCVVDPEAAVVCAAWAERLRVECAEATTDALASVAPVEGGKASTNYAVGDYLVFAGKLCKVTTAIATGETIAVGTNVSMTTVMAELIALTS